MSHNEALFGFGIAQKKSLMEYLDSVGLSPEQASAILALTAVTTANATDEATAIALANALKTKVNQIISALQA